MTNIIYGGLTCITLLVLIGMIYPFIFKTRGGRGYDRTEALNNIRQIGLGLYEFDSEYGQFPDKGTIAAVKADTGTKLTLDDSSSNKLFRQLIAAGLKSEKLYWAKTAISPRKPDDVFGTDSTALRAGECGFAYVAGLKSSDASELRS